MSADIEISRMLGELPVAQIKHIVVLRYSGKLEVYTRPMDIGYFQGVWASEDIKLLDGVWNSTRKTEAYVAFVICLKD